MPGHSTEIANEFIRLAQEKGQQSLTPMQLQKLVYLAHGWTLAVTDKKLVTDQVQAWDYGPVYRDLYRALRKYGPNPVTREIVRSDYIPSTPLDNTPATANLSDAEFAVIQKVFDTYGRFPAFKLSALTHQDGSPWSETYRPNEQSALISDDLIKRHFKVLGQFGGAEG